MYEDLQDKQRRHKQIQKKKDKLCDMKLQSKFWQEKFERRREREQEKIIIDKCEQMSLHVLGFCRN